MRITPHPLTLAVACTLGLAVTPTVGHADTLSALDARLAALALTDKIKVELAVSTDYRGKAPLHRTATAFDGTVVVAASPKGVRWIRTKGSSKAARASIWTDKAPEQDEPVLSDAQARELADPAATLRSALRDLELVEERAETHDGAPVTLLVLRPRAGAQPTSASGAVTVEAHLVLDADGVPVSLGRVGQLRLGPLGVFTERTDLRYGVADGRLVVIDGEVVATADGPLETRAEDRLTVRRLGNG